MSPPPLGLIAAEHLRNGAAILVSVGILFLMPGCQQAKRVDQQTTVPLAPRDPAVARGANERGLEYAERGDFKAAEAAFRGSLAADSAFAPARNNLGLVLLRRGRVYEAANAFSHASELDPAAIEPLLNLGRLYERVGWQGAAVDEYERVLARDRENAEARARLAGLRREMSETISLDAAISHVGHAGWTGRLGR